MSEIKIREIEEDDLENKNSFMMVDLWVILRTS